MAKKGVGEYQTRKENISKKEILKVLEDGKWHRFSEILKATGLSTATLSKHLKMLEGKLIQKKIDIESGEKPIPIYYRLNPKLQKTVDEWRKLLSKIDTYQIEESLQLLANQAISAYVDLLKQQPNKEYFEQAFQYSVLGFFEEGLKLLKLLSKESFI
jgi:DNA-binding HxlR family transcriptional regulator